MTETEAAGKSVIRRYTVTFFLKEHPCRLPEFMIKRKILHTSMYVNDYQKNTF